MKLKTRKIRNRQKRILAEAFSKALKNEMKRLTMSNPKTALAKAAGVDLTSVMRQVDDPRNILTSQRLFAGINKLAPDGRDIVTQVWQALKQVDEENKKNV